jgi:hypothetical protein
LTESEAAQIQAIANEFQTNIYVVGSRAAGRGHNTETNLPIGHDVIRTRSDIDFRFDALHPRANDLMTALRGVGNGAGTAEPQFNTNDPNRPIYRPYLDFYPNQ